MDSDTIFYKVTNLDGTPYHGGSGRWHLPKGSKPGKWMPKITPVVACKSGYHLVTIDQLLNWLGPTIWIAEGKGEHLKQKDKHVFSEARLVQMTHWNKDSARLFAADCAERVLHIFEERYPTDSRPREAINAARMGITGEVAAAAAAYAYAYADADDAAAAAAAAYAAAAVAADAAYADAADAYAERHWQHQRLAHYLTNGTGNE